MKKQHGFTLIELLVVIMILGIISVTAAPKFLNLGSDARASTMKGIKGTLDSASKLLHAKAAATGKHKGAEIIFFDGNAVTTYDGYPDPLTENLESILDIDTSEFQLTRIDDFETILNVIQPIGFTPPNDVNFRDAECAAIYSRFFNGKPEIYTQHLDKC